MTPGADTTPAAPDGRLRTALSTMPPPREAAGQVLLLAGQTWKEGLRRRMILIGFVLTVAFVALYGTGIYFAFRSLDEASSVPSGTEPGTVDMLMDPDAVRDFAAYQTLSFGLFISSFLSAMLVVFLASGMISGDAENGTLQTLVTRPVARVQILAGRFLGYASIYVAYIVLLAGSLMTLTWVFSGYAPPDPVQAVVLLSLEGLIILSLVCLGSTALSPLPTGVMVLMAYGVAFIGGIVQQIGTFLNNATAEQIGSAVHYLMPSDAFFRMALDRIAPATRSLFTMDMGPFGSPTPPTAAGVAYGLLYIFACLTAAAVLFRRKDI